MTRSDTLLLRTEWRLFRRDPAPVLAAVAFPVALLVVMGLAGRSPDPGLDGLSLVQAYVPVVLAFTLTVLGISALPGVLAAYREKGILRRLSTTPVSPSRVLLAQVAVQLGVAVATMAMLVTIAWIGFGVDVPGQPAGFVLVLLLTAAAVLGLGMLLAAVAPTGRIASGLGTLLFFPLMFLAGLWVPRQAMGDALRTASDLSPLGAAVAALQDTVDGHWPGLGHLAVLAAWALVSGLAATTLFRWGVATRMTEAQQLGRLASWERREGTALAFIPIVLLALCTAFTPLASDDLVTAPPVVVGLAVVTGAWMIARALGRRVPVGLHVAVLVALMAALVLLAPWFGFFTFTGYFVVVDLPGRWRAAGVVAVATITGTSQVGGAPAGDAGSVAVWLVVVGVNVLVAGVIIFFSILGEESRTRQSQLVEELTEVNGRLEATLRENEGLHAQLVEQAREAGVLDERGRMAGELHDTLAQGLVGIITQLEAADQAADPGRRQRHLERARRLARDSLSEARRTVYALRPKPLEDARLPEAVTAEARRWSELHGVPARVATTGVARPLRPEIEVALLRAMQEALANVARHAGARRVGVTLSYMPDVVTLDVRDDGVGFHAEDERDGGYGLVAMRRRVQGVAGTLEIESEPGTGTALSVSVPAPA